jgi:hypothetical protein
MNLVANIYSAYKQNQQDILNIKSLGYCLESMLISCTYNRILCTVDDFEWFYSYQYGNCYTFNSRIFKNLSFIKTISGQG